MHRVAPCRTAVQHVVSLLCRWAVAWRSHRLVGLALLLFLPAHVTALTAITDANVGTAAAAWVTNPTTATTTYGPIADWNTAAVTSMAHVCAASARRTLHTAVALGRSAKRRSRCTAAPPMHARAYVCAHTYSLSLARACTCAYVAAPKEHGIYLCVYTYIDI